MNFFIWCAENQTTSNLDFWQLFNLPSSFDSGTREANILVHLA